jgi:hypothetical protein
VLPSRPHEEENDSHVTFATDSYSDFIVGGGGGYYAYGPYGGFGIGGVVLIVLIVLLLTGRL